MTRTLVLLALLPPLTARAEIMVGESLDWLTVDADLVVRGEVVATNGALQLADVEALKGTLAGSTLTASLPARGCVTPDLIAGEPVVAFLRAEGTSWTARCATDRAEHWVVSLDDPEHAYALDGRALQSSEIVAYVRTAAKRPVSRAPNPAPTAYQRYALQQGPMRVEVTGPGAAEELWSGSAVYLAIPPYEDLRDDLLEQSRSNRWDERADAAKKLSNYPGPEVEARLRELLEDSHRSEHIDASGTVVDHSWPVREAAKRSLEALGAGVPARP